MTKEFKLFTTYQTRSICDADCVVSIMFVKRTAKTITCESGKRFRIFIYDGMECISPWGKYSMSPTITAEKEVE